MNRKQVLRLLLNELREYTYGKNKLIDFAKKHSTRGAVVLFFQDVKQLGGNKKTMPFCFIAYSEMLIEGVGEEHRQNILNYDLENECVLVIAVPDPLNPEELITRSICLHRNDPIILPKKLEKKTSMKVIISKHPCGNPNCERHKRSNKKCSKCEKIYYCSQACQRAHWSQHKLICL